MLIELSKPPYSELSDTIMNVVGAFMWVAVGGTALHYWNGYLQNHDFLHVASERHVRRCTLFLSQFPPFFH